MSESIDLKTLKLSEHDEGYGSGCYGYGLCYGFCWSLQVVLRSLGIEKTIYELRGLSLNAFAIWAHPTEPIKLWKEANCHLFIDSLLRSLGLRGDLLHVPEGKHNLLDHFLHHWKGMLENNLQGGVPVAAYGVWPESPWGLITDWDDEERLLKGLIPGSRRKLVNTCWPAKILVMGRPTVSLGEKTSLHLLMRNATRLGENKISHDEWVSGVDAYLMWLTIAKKNYSREKNSHDDLARHLAGARKDAALFLSHHTNFHNSKTERMMLALARRYNRVSEYLNQAANAAGKRAFLQLITKAAAEEEKALAQFDELLIYLG